MKIWGHPGIRSEAGHGTWWSRCRTPALWYSSAMRKHKRPLRNCSRCLSKGEVSTGFQGAKLGRYWYILEDIDDNNLQKDGTVRFLTSPHPRKCGDTGSSSNWGYYSIWFIMTGWWFGTWILWLSIQLGMSSSQLTIRLSFFRGVGWNHQPDMG